MKILHLLGSASRGGTETMTSLLVRHMGPGFENELCFLDRKGPVGEELEHAGLKVHYLPLRSPWALLPVVFRLSGLLRSGGYDILHLYGLKANLLGRLLGRILGQRRVLGGLRSAYPSGRKEQWTLLLDRLTFRLSLGYVSNSQAAIDFLASHGYGRRKFWLIHNGIDTRPFCDRSAEEKGALRQHYALPPDKPIITCVANLRPPKGHEYLIEALRELKERGLEFVALLVGDGPLRERLEESVQSLKLTEQVRFLGSRDHDEIPTILAITDVFVLPSLWEGLPTAIIEAMAAGCPVVGTAVGGMPELVIEGETGFLVPPGDPGALAERLELLLQDPALRNRLGEASADRVREHFSLERMVQQHQALYRALVESENP
ncbi:MAG: glycosyltransferase [Candidatus Acetothermia bacterium]|nr:glycosyltransferase [Candidatus Acetothermia bacterium]